jgi:PAS domain S-box-containing protein
MWHAAGGGIVQQTIVDNKEDGGATTQSVLERPQLWLLAGLTAIVAALEYLPEIFYALGAQIPGAVIELVSRDINLLLVPLPVFYAAHQFRMKGVVLVGGAIVALSIPLLAVSSSYAQPLLRLVVFTIFVVILGLLYAHALQKREEAARMYEQLQHSEERLRDFLENANDIIQSVDAQGRFVFTNRAWREALGYDASEVTGLAIGDVIHPDYSHMIDEMFARLGNGERMSDVRVAFVAKDGHAVYLEGSVNAEMRGERFVRTRCIYRDVTERRKLMGDLCASENRYRDLFEHSHEAIYTTERGGTIRDANLAMATLFGYQRDELVGRDVATLYADPADRRAFREVIERDGAVVDYAVDLRRKDGQVMKGLITAVAVMADDGLVRGYQGIVRSV